MSSLPSLLKSPTQQASLRKLPMRCMTNLSSFSPLCAEAGAGGDAATVASRRTPVISRNMLGSFREWFRSRLAGVLERRVAEQFLAANAAFKHAG